MGVRVQLPLCGRTGHWLPGLMQGLFKELTTKIGNLWPEKAPGQ